jgi:hypothetical protein
MSYVPVVPRSTVARRSGAESLLIALPRFFDWLRVQLILTGMLGDGVLHRGFN